MPEPTTLHELIEKLRREALESVPVEFKSRGLEYKYLKMDNYAAAQNDIADELARIEARLRAAQKEWREWKARSPIGPLHAVGMMDGARMFADALDAILGPLDAIPRTK